jgi:hypothetical protein
MATTSTSSNSKAIILDKPSDWRPWLFVVKGLANTGKVWKYIDPDLPTEPELPKLPELPSLTEVNASKATLSALDEKEKELYKLLLAVYKEETAKTTKIINAVDAVQTHIIKTVLAAKTIHIEDKTSAYQMLVALKKRLAFTDYTRKLELVNKYNKLKKFSKRKSFENWLND